jgi:hypothetical protein
MEKEQIGLFYQALMRRPLIEIVPEKGEVEHWEKTFSNANGITLYSWRNDWLKNLKANLEHFKYFNRENSVKIFFNELINKPLILVGAGPSLEGNIEYLALAKEKGIKIMVGHHSLMYLADKGIKPDYVVVLDAGEMWDDYYAFDKMDYSDVPLLADIVCNSEQLKKWPGPVKFYRSALPDNCDISKFLTMEMERIVPVEEGITVIEVAGHVMGAMLGLANGLMNPNTMIFVGADYCFRNDGKFYPFDYAIDKEVDGKYFDKPGEMLPAPPAAQGQILDIFGNSVLSTGAYLGFKNVMDQAIKGIKIQSLAQGGDKDFINASEGGSLGALVEGNSKWMHYMRLEEAVHWTVAKQTIKKEK